MRVILVLTAALALTAVGSAAAQPSAARATTVKVTATDFHFKLSANKVTAGRVTFVIHNASPALHDFNIARHTSQPVGRGKTTRLTVTLKPGRYLYTCTVDSHAELGMKGFLRVVR
jgi:plastocyanin